MLTVVVFGATGSAGACVVRQCLASPSVGELRLVTRRAPALRDPRMSIVLRDDFAHYGDGDEAFAGADLCLWCLGKSVSQVDGEAAYRRPTYDFAIAAAGALRKASPAATFHFVSGAGAALGSRAMWARVKAETERDLLAGTRALCWRPAAIGGHPSASEPMAYRVMRPALWLLRPFRGLYVSGDDLGRAMLQAHADGLSGRIVENREIRDLADRYRAG
ncbi:hypothetical protein [Luteitalea pratensis]|nr:hypothetical protein [Luteitalea pratensis]